MRGRPLRHEGEAGNRSRHHARHIGKVGRACPRAVFELLRRVKLPGVLHDQAVECQAGELADHALHLPDLDRRPRHERGAVHDADEPLFQLRNIFGLIGAQRNLCAGDGFIVVVGRAAALKDGGVELDVLPDVPAQELDALEGQNNRIQRAARELRRQRCVRRNAVERGLELAARQGLDVHRGVWRGMRHQRGVQLPEAAGLDHHLLALRAFLGRCAVDDERVILRCQALAQSLGDEQHDGTLHVVTAGVTHLEGVVFAEQSDCWLACAADIFGAECRVKAADAGFNIPAVFAQPAGQAAAGVVLLISHFGMIKDVVCHTAQFRSIDVHFFINHGLIHAKSPFADGRCRKFLQCKVNQYSFILSFYHTKE